MLLLELRRRGGIGPGHGELHDLPANDDCANALPLPETADCSTPMTGTVTSATPSGLVVSACYGGNQPGRDVWYRFVASGPMRMLTITSGFLASVDVWAGPCAAAGIGTPVFCSSVGVTVTAPSGANVTLFNALGQVLRPATAAGAGGLQVPTTELAAGLYMLRVRTKTGEISRGSVLE